jgi:hypothetical protein
MEILRARERKKLNLGYGTCSRLSTYVGGIVREKGREFKTVGSGRGRSRPKDYWSSIIFHFSFSILKLNEIVQMTNEKWKLSNDQYDFPFS